jgi:CDP-diglyceride synthetase
MFLAYDPTTNPLNNNEWSFPLLEIIHISAFTLSIGTIAIVDLGLLGWAKRGDPARLWKETSTLTLIGLVIMLTTGPLIFSSDPFMYLRNASFKFKMVALLVAIVYNYTIHKKVVLSGASPGVNKAVGIISLALWVSVVAGGLFIAFV